MPCTVHALTSSPGHPTAKADLDSTAQPATRKAGATGCGWNCKAGPCTHGSSSSHNGSQTLCHNGYGKKVAAWGVILEQTRFLFDMKR